MGGSILPVTIHNNKICFLFGKERDIDENPGWSDFGGGTDKGETFLQTACREGGEELTGFLGDGSDIKKLLNKYGTYNIDYKAPTYKSAYRTHLFPMEYDPLLVFYYNNNQRFLQKRLDPEVIKKTKIFEKAEIKWVCVDDLNKMKGQFRFFFRDIVDMIYKQRESIKSFIMKGLKTNNKNKTRKNRK